jgi:hypothetical protein
MAGGRRGPGMPGSADAYPGQDGSPAAGFASGQPLDVAPGCAVLGLFLEDAAGDDDRYAGASDDELLGVIRAQDRVEANVGARKHAAVAELIRWQKNCIVICVTSAPRPHCAEPAWR